MDEIQIPTKRPTRRRRWWIAAVVVLMAIIVGLVAAFPAFASSARARTWLLSRANAALAPASVEVANFHFSWFRPTLIDGFGLRDRHGKLVVGTSRAVWDRNLYRILFDRPRYGVLTLQDAKLDVERASNGKVDLAEILEPVLDGPEETDLTVGIAGGTLLFRDQNLVDPIKTQKLDVHVHRAAAPAPLVWNLAMANGVETLAISGSFLQREGSLGDLNLKVAANAWPLAVGSSQIAGRTSLTGTLAGGVEHGHWSLAGELGLSDPVLTGEALHGEPLTVGKAKIWGNTSSTETQGKAILGLEVASIESAGLKLGVVKIATVIDGKQLTIEPISTTLNGGKLTIVPEIVDDVKGKVLYLRAGTSLENAEVHEGLSHRVLSYVAPVLAGATRATGFVSARIDRAEIPLNAHAAQKTVIEGQVVFRDLEFTPGPLATDINALVGRADTTLRLDDPVVLSIANGRIHQRGLALPLGDKTRVEFEGSVGFDRTLDLRATVPLAAGMFPNREFLSEVVAGTRLTLPIGGTLDRPKIDKDAFGQAMANAGKNLLGRGAAGLLFRLIQPREEPAVPKPSGEEKRALRKERRAMKRGEKPG